MARPLVSTVIPTYNYGHYVEEAIRSVQSQTYQPVEIVVVDDGSTDDTRSRLESLGEAIRYLYQENKGLSAARNAGIRAARGEWVAFLDADDSWHPQKLQIQLDAVANLGGVSFLGSPVCGEPTEALDKQPQVRRLGVRDFLVSTPLTSSSALVKKHCFNEVGLFDEGLKSVEDRDMWLRLADRFPAATVVSPCVSYRSHSAQMSRNPLRMYKSLDFVLQRFFAQHPEHSKLRPLATAFLHRDASLAYLEAGDYRASLGHMVRSVLSYPAHLSPLTGRYLRAKVLLRLIAGDAGLRWLKRVRRS